MVGNCAVSVREFHPRLDPVRGTTRDKGARGGAVEGDAQVVALDRAGSSHRSDHRVGVGRARPIGRGHDHVLRASRDASGMVSSTVASSATLLVVTVVPPMVAAVMPREVRAVHDHHPGDRQASGLIDQMTGSGVESVAIHASRKCLLLSASERSMSQTTVVPGDVAALRGLPDFTDEIWAGAQRARC